MAGTPTAKRFEPGDLLHGDWHDDDPVTPRGKLQLNFADLSKQLEASGTVSANRFLLKYQVTDGGEGYEFTVFPDGRAIIKGTDSIERARVLYSKYIGH